MSEIRNLRKYLTNFKMKSLRTIFLVAVLGLVACEKDPVEEPPVVTPEKTPTEIACDAYNHPDTTAYYHKDGDWCEKIFTGQPPVEQKKDTLINFEAYALAIGNPSPELLDSIAKLQHIANMYLDFDNEYQYGTMATFGNVANILRGCLDRNPNARMVGGNVYVGFDPAINPTKCGFETFKNMGVTLVFRDPNAKSGAKSSNAVERGEKNWQDAEKTRTMKRLER